MRSVIKTHAYKRDFTQESSGKNRTALTNDLPDVIAMLAADTVIPAKYRDHMLTGNWAQHGECHIKPDLLLVYMKIGETTDSDEEESGELRLVRLGSHSKLF